VEVCIDTTGVVAESDEADNCLTETFTIGAVTEIPEGTYGNIQSLSYTYDDIGNIIQITDTSITPSAETTFYTYDDLYRLSSATAYEDSATTLYDISYEYDAIGNMTYKSDIGTILYENTNPYQASSVNGVAYTYDSAGNLTSDDTYSYTYNYRNEMTESSDGFSYSYDPGGIRYAKINSAESSETYYINQHYETSSTMGATTYIYGNGLQVATVADDGETTYNHHDHLGGITVTTDENDVIKQILDYYPYGAEYMNERYGISEPSRYSYTGKELDESGLYYFSARYYIADIGRFASQDPAVYDGRLFPNEDGPGLIADPQSLNSYTYCRDNPLGYVDVGGERPGYIFWKTVASTLNFHGYEVTGTLLNYAIASPFKITEHSKPKYTFGNSDIIGQSIRDSKGYQDILLDIATDIQDGGLEGKGSYNFSTYSEDTDLAFGLGKVSFTYTATENSDQEGVYTINITFSDTYDFDWNSYDNPIADAINNFGFANQYLKELVPYEIEGTITEETPVRKKQE